MGKVFSQFRLFAIMIAVLLALMPMSVLADVGKEEINYVSLGDSLAEGLLYDGQTIGKGYVGEIVEELTSNGYEVQSFNEGVRGYTTTDVLEDLPSLLEEEIANADIITLSAGANDLLGELDQDKIARFDPDEIEKIGIEAANLIEPIFINIGGAATELTLAVEELNQLLQEVTGDIENLPQELQEELKSIETDFEALQENIVAVNDGLGAAKLLLSDGELNIILHLNDAVESLSAATANIVDMLTTVENIDEELLDSATIQVVEEMKVKMEGIETAIEALKNEVSSGIDTILPYLSELDTLLKEAQEISQMLESVEQKLSDVAGNLGEIIGTIQKANPHAKIYVMEYYNALPYLSAGTQQYTVPLIEGLNEVIAGVAEAAGATTIPTFSAFVGKHEVFLPNPADIHPSEAGYKAIAAEFMKEIAQSFPKITEPTPEPETPSKLAVDLGETIDVSKGQLIEINNTEITLLLPNDLPDGTKLTVTATDKEKLAKAKNLKAVGTVLNFDFQFPTGYENFTGVYQLTMGFDSDTDQGVDIYYFDEIKDTWVKQNGEVNNEAKIVLLEVSHFSDYGVFAGVEEKEDPIIEDKVDPPVVAEDEQDNKDGGILPKTATNYYNVLFLGGALLVLAAVILIVDRNRKTVES